MGTDIYMYAEVRRGGAWRPAEPLVRNEYYVEGGGHTDGAEYRPREMFDDRDYVLFAVLAGVRRSRHTDTDYEPVSEPKGLPEDLSPELRGWAGRFGGDIYCPSWLTLRELLEYNWHGKAALKRAMVDARAAHLFADGWGEFPPHEDWPEGVPRGYGTYVAGGVEVTWIENYGGRLDYFLRDVIPKLRAYGAAEDVRIVFWFLN
ncbi:MAG TPA: hypothetical protein VF736_10990 [Pyrinomonadaceae bacterium]|jgi:hypothetical protein